MTPKPTKRDKQQKILLASAMLITSSCQTRDAGYLKG
jgi:hypothetical protein